MNKILIGAGVIGICAVAYFAYKMNKTSPILPILPYSSHTTTTTIPVNITRKEVAEIGDYTSTGSLRAFVG